MAYGQAAGLTSFAGIVKRIRLFCTVYDPKRDGYRFDYSIFVGGTIGAVSLAVIGFILFRAWRRQRSMGKARLQ